MSTKLPPPPTQVENRGVTYSLSTFLTTPAYEDTLVALMKEFGLLDQVGRMGGEGGRGGEGWRLFFFFFELGTYLPTNIGVTSLRMMDEW